MKEIYSCAFRGRGKGWKHQLEIRKDGLCNCITHATKDFYVLEKTKAETNRIFGEWFRKTSIEHDMGCDENKSDNYDIG